IQPGGVGDPERQTGVALTAVEPGGLKYEQANPHADNPGAADRDRARRCVCDRSEEQRRHGRGRRNTCRTAPLASGAVRVSNSHPPYGVRRCTTLTTNAPLSGRASARVSGKRNRASGSVVYPEFHTRKTSSPITGIQWNRILKSTRSLSLPYWTNASRLVRVLKAYSNRFADSTAVNAPTGKRAVVRVKSVLTRT